MCVCVCVCEQPGRPVHLPVLVFSTSFSRLIKIKPAKRLRQQFDVYLPAPGDYTAVGSRQMNNGVIHLAR